MNDDNQPKESVENRDAGTVGTVTGERDGAVTGTYTDISGRPAFVIATVDHADAWLAVPPDAVVDTDEVR